MDPIEIGIGLGLTAFLGLVGGIAYATRNTPQQPSPATMSPYGFTGASRELRVQIAHTLGLNEVYPPYVIIEREVGIGGKMTGIVSVVEGDGEEVPGWPAALAAAGFPVKPGAHLSGYRG